ncbi:hypothetical protein R3P38DRAFT_2759618 [Favolaschia claudopus]|uniref:Uncharacterized protein n=1 Tax=Favolaschia claudopus TaxID=2862362 RepID=A0AAW0E0B6_9AGAR
MGSNVQTPRGETAQAPRSIATQHRDGFFLIPSRRSTTASANGSYSQTGIRIACTPPHSPGFISYLPCETLYRGFRGGHDSGANDNAQADSYVRHNTPVGPEGSISLGEGRAIYPSHTWLIRGDKSATILPQTNEKNEFTALASAYMRVCICPSDAFHISSLSNLPSTPFSPSHLHHADSRTSAHSTPSPQPSTLSAPSRVLVSPVNLGSSIPSSSTSAQQGRAHVLHLPSAGPLSAQTYMPNLTQWYHSPSLLTLPPASPRLVSPPALDVLCAAPARADADRKERAGQMGEDGGGMGWSEVGVMKGDKYDSTAALVANALKLPGRDDADTNARGADARSRVVRRKRSGHGAAKYGEGVEREKKTKWIKKEIEDLWRVRVSDNQRKTKLR